MIKWNELNRAAGPPVRDSRPRIAMGILSPATCPPGQKGCVAAPRNAVEPTYLPRTRLSPPLIQWLPPSLGRPIEREPLVRAHREHPGRMQIFFQALVQPSQGRAHEESAVR
jgi:hypothetical protein